MVTSDPRLTLILHTRNRPAFLRRTLLYLNELRSTESFKVIVTDASDEHHWREFARISAADRLCQDVRIVHEQAGRTLIERLIDSLRQTSTPFVALAADDDFPLPGWFDQACDLLEAQADVAVVHGHMIMFELEASEPTGRIAHAFTHPRADPPISWLEDEKPSARIASTGDGTNDPSVPGWYAVQRTADLLQIWRLHQQLGIGDRTAEYWLVFLQNLLGKTVMLDRYILARQAFAGTNHPLPLLDRWQRDRAMLSQSFLDLLKDSEDISDEAAARVVDRFLGGITAKLEFDHRRSDLRKLLRVPLIRWLRDRIGRQSANRIATRYPDPRLPPLPRFDRSDPMFKLVERWTCALSPGSP